MRNFDPRYNFSLCSACRREWQHIDWGCALHHFTCNEVTTARRLPPILHTNQETR